ncbi:hypothetical protein SAMN05216366_11154 [Selenomonas ruminantium]|uniref:Phage-Barnase-EndoU-ColicinE5/D-RelE like nuclease 4 domain-containing protein n=2 Tax=Selenomonas ruminantium TaxID=971 RepID=A0A1H0RAV0_SELRU|nr:hypothetical protein SAMN05216366_11154 [Selenomonas ruminantium]
MSTDILRDAASTFLHLTNYEYHIILGRKMKQTHLTIRFLPDNFYHLAGLQKLKSAYPFQNLAHDKVFRQILSQKITANDISKDKAFPLISDRLKVLAHLDTILDSNFSNFFRYDKNKIPFYSALSADYIVKGTTPQSIITFATFVNNNNVFYGNSIFPLSNFDYSKGQMQYTVLLKEKLNLKTNEVTTLFHHKKYHLDEIPNAETIKAMKEVNTCTDLVGPFHAIDDLMDEL